MAKAILHSGEKNAEAWYFNENQDTEHISLDLRVRVDQGKTALTCLSPSIFSSPSQSSASSFPVLLLYQKCVLRCWGVEFWSVS